MFTTIHSGPRVKQQLSFLLSLGIQASLLALLCFMPAPRACCNHSLAHPKLNSALAMPLAMPLSLLEPPPAIDKGSLHSSLPPKPSSQPAPALKAPAAPPAEAKLVEPKTEEPAAKSLEPAQPLEPQPKPDEAAPSTDTTAEAAADNGNAGDGLAQFPAWQMHSDTSGHGFMHHQVSSALPIFTPDPPILHGQFPDAARGKDIVMNVVINEQGDIVAVQVLQGIGDGVENAIVETLRRWIYVPAKINGMAIMSQKQVRFHFPG